MKVVKLKPSELKHTHKFLYDQISTENVAKATDYLLHVSEHASNFDGLKAFNTFGKWYALMFMMKRQFGNELMSKTDIARNCKGMSRDGAMKWIETLLNQKYIYQHHDPSIDKDKRKYYILPHRDLTTRYYEYIRERLLMTSNHIGEAFSIGDHKIDSNLQGMTETLTDDVSK